MINSEREISNPFDPDFKQPPIPGKVPEHQTLQPDTYLSSNTRPPRSILERARDFFSAPLEMETEVTESTHKMPNGSELDSFTGLAYHQERRIVEIITLEEGVGVDPTTRMG